MTDSQVWEKLERLELKLDTLLVLIDGKIQEYFTVKETADFLRCSVSSIRDKMRNGTLPFQRLGNSETSPILISRKDIGEMLK